MPIYDPETRIKLRSLGINPDLADYEDESNNDIVVNPTPTISAKSERGPIGKAWDWMNKGFVSPETLYSTPAFPITGIMSQVAPTQQSDSEVLRGAKIGAAKLGSGILSPIGTGTMLAGPALTAVKATPAVVSGVTRGIAGLFGANAALQVPSSIKATYEAAHAGDVAGTTENVISALANLGIGAVAGKHALTKPTFRPQDIIKEAKAAQATGEPIVPEGVSTRNPAIESQLAPYRIPIGSMGTGLEPKIETKTELPSELQQKIDELKVKSNIESAKNEISSLDKSVAKYNNIDITDYRNLSVEQKDLLRENFNKTQEQSNVESAQKSYTTAQASRAAEFRKLSRQEASYELAVAKFHDMEPEVYNALDNDSKIALRQVYNDYKETAPASESPAVAKATLTSPEIAGIPPVKGISPVELTPELQRRKDIAEELSQVRTPVKRETSEIPIIGSPTGEKVLYSEESLGKEDLLNERQKLIDEYNNAVNERKKSEQKWRNRETSGEEFVKTVKKETELINKLHNNYPNISYTGAPGLQQEKQLSELTQIRQEPIVEGAKEKGISLVPTKEWSEVFKKLGIIRGVHVDTSGRVFKTDGTEVNGEAYVRDGLRTTLARINPNLAGLDTWPHELFHVFYDDIKNLGSKSDNAVLGRANKAIESNPDYINWKNARDVEGKSSTPDEYLTQLAGEDTVRRVLGTDSKGGFKNWMSDFWSHVKQKFSKATPEDYARLMSNKLIYDRSFEGSGSVVPGSISQNAEEGIPAGQSPEMLLRDRKLLLDNYKQAAIATEDAFKLYGYNSPEYKAAFEKELKFLDKVNSTYPDIYDGGNRGLNAEESLPKKEPDRSRVGIPGMDSIRGSQEPIMNIRDYGSNLNNYIKWLKEVKGLSDEEAYKVRDSLIRMDTISKGITPNKRVIDLGESPANEESLPRLQLAPSAPLHLPESLPPKEVVELPPLAHQQIENLSAPWGVKYLASEVDRIALKFKNSTGNLVSKQLHSFYGWMDDMIGQITNKQLELLSNSKLGKENFPNIVKYLYDMDSKGSSTVKLNNVQQKFADKFVEIIREPRILQQQLGLQVETSKGNFRKAGIKPEGYFPNMLDPAVSYEWANNSGSAKSKAYDKAYIDHLISNNVEPKLAQQTLDAYKAALGNRVTPNIEFNAIDKAEGLGLPYELVDKNLGSVMSRYGRRAARHLAFFKYIQSDPRMQKALNIPDQFGNRVDAASHPDIEDIHASPEVQEAMKSLFNVDKSQFNEKLGAANRLIANIMMGFGTGGRNLLQIPTFISPYIKSSQLPLATKAFAEMNEAAGRAFQHNAIRASFADLDVAGDYSFSPNNSVRRLAQGAYILRKYQGRELSDKMEGLYTYTLGELLAKDNLYAAKNGDVASQAFLKRFGDIVDGGVERLFKPGEKVTADDIGKIAKRFTDATRGTYSPEGLPSFALRGSVAPFTSLTRFSLEKSNTIWKDVAIPLKNGNYGPLLKLSLGGLLTGAAIEQLNQFLTNKRGPDATIKETLVEATPENVTSKIISLLQLSTAAGIVTDGAKVAMNMAQGKSIKYVNPLSFPIYSFIADDVANNTQNLIKAIRGGDDSIAAIGDYAVALLNQSSQTFRYVDAKYIHPELAKRKERFRDLRVFNELEGQIPEGPVSDTLPDLVSGQKKKQFKETGDITEAQKLAPELIAQAVEKAGGDITKLRVELDKIKPKSYATMPSPDTKLPAFIKYADFLKQTQGEEEKNKRIEDYFRQNSMNRVKSGMIP